MTPPEPHVLFIEHEDPAEARFVKARGARAVLVPKLRDASTFVSREAAETARRAYARLRLYDVRAIPFAACGGI